jgi:hypothetical protein
MPVRFEIDAGMLQVVQSFDFPAVYLDHWAIRHFSSDEALSQRFLNALKSSGGSLVVSRANLAELTGPDDLRHAEEAAFFFESALPNIYFALFNIQDAIDQETRSRNSFIRLPAPPDIELLRAVGKDRPDDIQPFSIARLIKIIAAHRERLGASWIESNQRLADHINKARANSENAKQAKSFENHPTHIPTRAVMLEMLRPMFLDKSLKIDENDAADLHHAIMSITYCDYVLLDGKWEDFHERMVRRFDELQLPIRVAKVFSKRRGGVELFLTELEGRASLLENSSSTT